MTDGSDGERHSEALSADLITDPDEKARREARNGLQQFDTVIELIEDWLQADRPFKLRASTILQLHRVALDGLSAYAGNYRPAGIKIGGSEHEPEGAYRVPELVEELCDYVIGNWHRSAIHLSAYVMWRLNWIHPFTDGNGRTSRALSYLVLCVRLGHQLPVTKTIPDQISSNKTPYYKALEAADKIYKVGEIDVSSLEQLISNMLAEQLYQVHLAASEGTE